MMSLKEMAKRRLLQMLHVHTDDDVGGQSVDNLGHRAYVGGLCEAIGRLFGSWSSRGSNLGTAAMVRKIPFLGGTPNLHISVMPLLLTATPLQNSLLELHGLVSIIDNFAFRDLKIIPSKGP